MWWCTHSARKDITRISLARPYHDTYTSNSYMEEGSVMLRGEKGFHFHSQGDRTPTCERMTYLMCPLTKNNV